MDHEQDWTSRRRHRFTIAGTLVLPLATLLASTPAATAAVLLADGFGDGDRNNDGTLDGPVDNAADLGAVWYRARGSNSSNSPNVTIVDDDGAGGIGSGNAMSVVPGSSSSRQMAFNFPAVALTAVGDSISITFDTRITSSPVPGGGATGDRRYRLGLYNHGGTALAGDFQGNDTGTISQVMHDDVGIFAQIDVGAADGTTADLRWEAAGDAPLGGTSTSFGANTTNANAALSTNTKRTIALKLTLIATNDIQSVLTIDGTDYITRSTSQGSIAPLTATFNEFIITQNGLDVNYVIDNVLLSHTPAPEPASMTLLVLGSLLVCRPRSA